MPSFIKLLSVAVALCAAPAFAVTCPAAFQQTLAKLHSTDQANLCDYFNDARAVLVVNTASHCGFTKQFGDLQALYQKYQTQGLVILGFPSNSFFQEEKTEEGTANVCYKNYGVTFPMFTHVAVKGDDANPAFAFLAMQTTKPKWNFNKYLLTDSGITHFGSRAKPLASELEQAVADALASP